MRLPGGTFGRLAGHPAVAMLGLHWRSSPLRCALFWTAALTVPLLGLASTLASAAVVGTVAAALRDGMHGVPGTRIASLLALVAGLQVARAVAASLQGLATGALRLCVAERAEQMLMEAANAPTGIAHMEDPAFADAVRRARGAGGVTPDQTVQYVAAPVSRVVVAAGSCVMLAAFRWWLPLLMLAAAAVQHRWVGREMGLLTASMGRSAQGIRRAGYTYRLATDAAAAKEVRVFGLAQWLLDRFAAEWSAGMAEPWRRRRELRRPAVLAALLAVGSTSVAIGMVAAAAAQGHIGLAMLALCVQAVPSIALLGFAQDSGAFLPMGAAAAQALIDLHAQHTSAALASPHGRRRAGTLPRECIRLEGVHFSYPGRARPVLDGLDLTVEAGRSLAIVGENGAGKTTLVKLLARLYEPSAGRISVDGVPLPAIAPDAWRERVSVVFQDFVRYPVSARDNVGFGDVAAAMDESLLRSAAEQAGAAQLVEALPAGWDTLLSRQHGGVDLSGGQWQRIAVARALLRARRGGLLILDEATANLDVRAESEFFDRLLEVTRGLTTVLVSHRFSSVRRADRIVVLEGGRVVEDGTHDQLMSARGRYAAMFTVQARPYLLASHA